MKNIKRAKKRKLKKPFFLLYYPIATFLILWYKIKHKVVIKKNSPEKIKAPSIILSTHPSFLDFVHVVALTYPHRVTVVGNRFYDNIKPLNYLLRAVGLIPKRLFTPDIDTIKSIMLAIKNNHIVVMMPEGRLSADGTNFELANGTPKLIKKLGVDVYRSHCVGAYYAKPRWAKEGRRCNLELNLDKLLSKEELQEISIKDLEVFLNEKMSYEDRVIGKILKCKDRTLGLDDIINYCPECDSFLSLNAKNNTVRCSKCGAEVFLDETCHFTSGKFQTIHDWYAFQSSTVRERILKENFVADVDVLVQNGKIKKFVGGGSGKLILSKDCVEFISFDDKTPSFQRNLDTLEAMPFSTTRGLQIYIGNDLHFFMPKEHSKQMVLFSSAVDELWKMRNERAEV